MPVIPSHPLSSIVIPSHPYLFLVILVVPSHLLLNRSHTSHP